MKENMKRAATIEWKDRVMARNKGIGQGDGMKEIRAL